MHSLIQSLRKKVAGMPYFLQMMILALAAFGCYTSMYAYRKSFAAGVFMESDFLGVHYKVWLVIAQVVGYMLSKFYGIKFISELGTKRRGLKIVVLVGIAWLALLGFAIAPKPYNVFFMFLNGLPLGMIWGLVFSYLEGRRLTELLAAVMSVSLVFASGFVKTIARTLIENYHVSEYWMPFSTGLLFALPLLGCTLLLELMPQPDEQDKQLRTERKTMNARERKQFFKSYAPGLLLAILIYLLFTILRDLRDNFEVEIWADIGFVGKDIYAKVDTTIAVIVLLMMSLLILVKNNMKALSFIYLMLFIGCLLAGLSSYFYEKEMLSGLWWMMLAGLGLYMVYIPFNAIFFERFLATFREKGNIGFLMYTADAIGYLGSVGVLLFREFGPLQLGWGAIYQKVLLFSSIVGSITLLISFLYFWNKKQRKNRKKQTEKDGVTWNEELNYSGL